MKNSSALHRFLGHHAGKIAGAALIAIVLITDKYYCPFKAAFGIPCPGCGIIRGITALSKGDIKGALGYNLLVFALPVFAVLYLFCRRYIKKPLPQVLIIIAAAVFTLFNWLRLIALGI